MTPGRDSGEFACPTCGRGVGVMNDDIPDEFVAAATFVRNPFVCPRCEADLELIAEPISARTDAKVVGIVAAGKG